MFSANTEQLAKNTFQHAELGDKRCTKRLVQLAGSLANQTGQSLVQSLNSSADEESEDKLYDFVETLKSAGDRQVGVKQKGGRQARVAHCEVCYSEVSLKVPKWKQGESLRL